MNPVSDNTDSVARNGERTSEVEIPIIIFPALAIGLVVIGFGVRFLMKDAGTRGAQTVDHTEAVTISSTKATLGRLTIDVQMGPPSLKRMISSHSCQR